MKLKPFFIAGLAWLLTRPLWAEHPQLNDFLKQVNAHHPKIRASQLLPEIAASKVREKEGAFDPQLFMETEWLRYQSPTAPGKPKYANDNQIGVQMQDLSGLKIRPGYRVNRLDVKSPDSLTGSAGEFFVDLKLPLMRGFQINEKRTALEQAKVAQRAADAVAKLIVIEVQLKASLSYWEWAAACTHYRLVEKNWSLAEERAKLIEKRTKSGDLAPIDLVEAKQEAIRRWEQVLKARRQVQKTSLKLGLFSWDDNFKNVAPPEENLAPNLLPGPLAALLLSNSGNVEALETPAKPQLGEWEMQALQQRPELAEIKFDKEILSLDASQAENDRLPQVDLSLSPGLDMGNKSIGLTYKAGISVTIPLGTRGPDGRLQVAQLKTKKLEVDQVLETQRILTEVRDGFSLLEMASERTKATSQSVELAAKLESAERTKFQFGDSTLFLVNQRERATLAEAQKLVDTMLDSLMGESLLRAARGEVL
jgi:outer membrane protein